MVIKKKRAMRACTRVAQTVPHGHFWPVHQNGENAQKGLEGHRFR